MKLISVLAYNQFALLEFEKEIDASDSSRSELVISDVPGARYGDRLSVTPYADTPADFMIVDCKWSTRSVSKSSYYESGSEEVKAAYEEVKAAVKEVMILAKEKSFLNDDDEAFGNLLKNSASEKVLAAGVDGTSCLQNIKSISSLVGKARLEISGKLLNCHLQLEKARERASAAQSNLRKLTEVGGGGCCPPLTSLSQPQDLYEIEKWFRSCRTVDVNDIKITYSAPTPQKVVKLKVEYLVTDANWRPEFNFKFSGARLECCEVEYSVAISQRTGISWQNIPICLSKGDPTSSQQPPPLKKTFVDLEPQPAVAPPGHALYGGVRAAAVKLFSSADGGAPFVGESLRPSFGNQKIKLPPATVIPSGVEEQKIIVSRFSLSAKLFHHVIPDSEKKAYRAFLLTNSSDWVIENNEALNVYIQGGLIGTSRLSRAIGRDQQFVLYAGEDDLVEVTDLGDKDFKSKSGNFLSGNTQRSTTASQLIFKNRHESSCHVDLVVSHKLPESKDQQIVVAVGSEVAEKAAKTVAAENDIIAAATKNTGDVINTKTGSYIQHKVLDAGESWQVEFAYSITYPKNENIKIWTENIPA